MRVATEREQTVAAFTQFVGEYEPRLRQALVAAYGPVDGSEATADALSWAWEHWGRLADIVNKPAYLYRVGQSATRRFLGRPLPPGLVVEAEAAAPDLSPELLPALGRLSIQQRTVVVLVHGYGWRQSEVAELLEINPSTVREHLNRALDRLRTDLEVSDAN
jgi:RNA polymerase sigma factor (sigma-70 family)